MTVTPLMRSEAISLGELFRRGRFRPAPVQRDFQWSANECRQLLSELDKGLTEFDPTIDAEADTDAGGESMADVAFGRRIDDLADDEPYADDPADDPADEPMDEPEFDARGATAPEEKLDQFYLGAIVVNPAEDGGWEVFDGLQRLTTLTILFAVLRDVIADPDLADELHELVVDADEIPRLTLPGRDPALATRIQARGEARRRRFGKAQSPIGSRVLDVAALCRNVAIGWSEARRAAFARYMTERVFISLVETRSRRLARNIFVTTNLYGLPLDRIDLFKGQLVDLANDDDEAERVVASWDEMADLLQDGFSDFVLAADALTRARTLDMRQLLNHRPREAERLTFLRDLLEQAGAPVGRWVTRLRDYAEAWAELRERSKSPGDGPVDRDLWRLGLFRWPEWRPLALFWYERMMRRRRDGPVLGSAAAAFERNFDLLHRRCMAVDLYNYGDAARETIFLRATRQATQGRSPFRAARADGKPTTRDDHGALTFDARARQRIDDRLRQHLDDDEMRLTLMRWIEASLWTDRIPAYLGWASVEHVLPQRPERRSQWLTDFPEPQARENACHSLGNLAVMDAAANRRIENFDFAAKLPVLRAQSERYATLKSVVDAERWTAEGIAARAETMRLHVWSELKLPHPSPPAAQKAPAEAADSS